MNELISVIAGIMPVWHMVVEALFCAWLGVRISFNGE
jgi:hypothetical protein